MLVTNLYSRLIIRFASDMRLSCDSCLCSADAARGDVVDVAVKMKRCCQILNHDR